MLDEPTKWKTVYKNVRYRKLKVLAREKLLTFREEASKTTESDEVVTHEHHQPSQNHELRATF